MDSTLYPDLSEMVESRGICPICLMEMGENFPKYQCENSHWMCYRCKPYFYGCSVCDGYLNYVQPAEIDSLYGRPAPVHFMPHPMTMEQRGGATPTAPELDFMDNERRAWGPPPPEPNQNLIRCRHSVYGCWIKVPEFLRDLHETRCQFRPFLEVEHLPTDLHSPGGELVPCTHAVVGCNVMMPPWRKGIHEPLCIFKGRYEALIHGEPEPEEPEADIGDGDPDELVECKLKIYGCMVKMPRRRKLIHEEKCNYIKFFKPEDFEEPQPEDPEAQVECRWAEHGCRTRPKFYRKEIHEEKCNYKAEECVNKDNGCEETFPKSRKFAHERNCEFQNSQR